MASNGSLSNEKDNLEVSSQKAGVALFISLEFWWLARLKQEINFIEYFGWCKVLVYVSLWYPKNISIS